MNRLVCTNLQGVAPDRLPPMQSDGRTRVLFLNTTSLGFTTQARQLEHYAGLRDDIDAVHVNLARPMWMKLLGKSLPIPGGWDQHSYRYWWMYRRLLDRWLRGPLDARRFDVVHWMTQHVAGAVLDLRPFTSARFVLHIDATERQSVSEFGESILAHRPFLSAERRMFAAADRVVCMSRWAADSLRRDYGLADDRVLAAPASVSAVAEGSPAPREGALVRIVFVGNDWHRKGGPLLLRLHQQRLADRAELHVVSALAPVDRQARNVVWHGVVAREKLLDQILPAMDLFAMPTQQDTLLWAALEAQASGLPVVASRLAAIPEVVADGVTGLLCAPAIRPPLPRRWNAWWRTVPFGSAWARPPAGTSGRISIPTRITTGCWIG